jgi:hypothetical protein
VTAATWIFAGLMAVLGVYLALRGANPVWTLAAGIGVGMLVAVALRNRSGDR